MTEHVWRVAIELPIPAGATEQAKILTKLAAPLETFRKALPDGHTCDDRVVKVRPDAGVPRGPRSSTAQKYVPPTPPIAQAAAE